MRLYMPIQKAEELDDGTLRVTGIASTESVDAAGEVVKADAIEGALPEFFKFGTGPLREMHQLSAAGTVDKAEVVDGITSIEATVVDPVAIKKVKAGVYKGFSIGGNVGARDAKDKKLITKIRLSEISLVDRPCNPDAVITMYKAEDTPMPDRKAQVAELAELLDKGGDELLADLLKAAHAKLDPPPAEAPAADVVEKAAETPAADAAAAPAGDAPASEAHAPAADAPAQKVETPSGEKLAKGLYDLKCFIDAITQIGYLTQSAQGEAMYEGDNSPLPEKLRAWLTAGVAILAEMTAEETSEMLAMLAPKQAADAGGELAKVDEAKAAEELRKAELAERDEKLTKALAAVDTLSADLAKATARIEALEKQPAPGKALLKAMTKGEDVALATPEPTVAPILKADGTVDEVATELKKIHAAGGRPVRIV